MLDWLCCTLLHVFLFFFTSTFWEFLCILLTPQLFKSLERPLKSWKCWLHTELWGGFVCAVKIKGYWLTFVPNISFRWWLLLLHHRHRLPGSQQLRLAGRRQLPRCVGWPDGCEWVVSVSFCYSYLSFFHPKIHGSCSQKKLRIHQSHINKPEYARVNNLVPLSGVLCWWGFFF